MDHDTRFSVCDMAAEADADVLMDIEVYVNLNGLCVKRSAGIVAVLDHLRSFKSIERFHQRLTSQTEKLSYYLVHEVPMSKRRAAEVVNMVGRTIERMPLAHYTLANSKLLFAAMTLVVRNGMNYPIEEAPVQEQMKGKTTYSMIEMDKYYPRANLFLSHLINNSYLTLPQCAFFRSGN